MRVPLATYRLQLNADFTFDDALEIVDYLHQLGVSDLYASPILQARAGSTHGYDVADPTRISDDLGGQVAFNRLTAALDERGMGLLLDIVPNHMAASLDNPWWLDVLRHGPDSRYARYFDIDWNAPRPGLRGKVLLPILGDHVHAVLERGEIEVEQAEDGAWIRYYDWRLPVSESERSRDSLRAYLEAVDGGAGWSRLAALDRLLESQHYRLSYWRLANQEVNYRRFFDITDLVSLRIQDWDVFDDVHQLVLELVAAGQVTGLRIDHVDGLHDPRAYLKRLSEEASRAAGDPVYIAVEKILVGDETLPGAWPVAGTTGYDMLNRINGVLADGGAAEQLNAVYREFTGSEQSFPELVREAKHLVIDQLFAGDLRRLGLKLWRIADADLYGRDLSFNDLQAAVAEVTACFPVYRSYATGEDRWPEDAERIRAAVAEAREHRPELDAALGFLERVLLMGDPPPSPGQRDAWLAFIQRWQQFTGPVTAKGLEDTSLYIDTRLISMNAVGGEPEVIEISIGGFHRWVEQRSRDWPHAMNATSTHDSKRSEDVNARINVLSEVTDEWTARARRWRTMNEDVRRHIEDQEVPGPRMELLLYQTLLGAWPFEASEVEPFKQRLKDYAIKASREAKVHTSWIDQSPEYEDALLEFIDDILDESPGNEFLADLQSFLPVIAWHGALNSLSQTLMKITLPGVPDIYRGTELWDFSLVDPDNRRPVDYARYRAVLERVRRVEPERSVELFDDWQSGAVKLYLTNRALQARRDHRQLFEDGEYSSLRAEGDLPRHVVVFARRAEDGMAVVVAPRLTAQLLRPSGGMGRDLPVGEDVWGDTKVCLPAGAPATWRNALTNQTHGAAGGKLLLGDLFARFPFALLLPE